jgi:hypothetical protein
VLPVEVVYPPAGCSPPSVSKPAMGTKSPRARTFDGYKSHLGVDPGDELITAVATAANTADRARPHASYPEVTLTTTSRS